MKKEVPGLLLSLNSRDCLDHCLLQFIWECLLCSMLSYCLKMPFNFVSTYMYTMNNNQELISISSAITKKNLSETDCICNCIFKVYTGMVHEFD